MDDGAAAAAATAATAAAARRMRSLARSLAHSARLRLHAELCYSIIPFFFSQPEQNGAKLRIRTDVFLIQTNTYTLLLH